MTQATTLDGTEMLPFAKGGDNGFATMSQLKEEIRGGLLTETKAASDYQKKLKAGEGIEIGSDGTIKTTLDTTPFKVVSALPSVDIENKIYLIADTEGSAAVQNEYIEYLYVGGKWEVVGRFHAKVDLTPYQTKSEAEATYAKKTQLPDMSLYVLKSTYDTLAATLSSLQTEVGKMKQTLETIPTIPGDDGKVYAILNRQWAEIADIGESLLVATDN